mgnify:CR=1 FL=1
MNTTNEAEIEEAYQWLIDQRDTMDPIYAGDDVIDNMISGNKSAGSCVLRRCILHYQ